MKHYAIEIIGSRFAIKQVLSNGCTRPVNGRAYRTVEDAMTAAGITGIEIDCVGDLYDIIGIAG